MDRDLFLSIVISISFVAIIWAIALLHKAYIPAGL